MFTKYAAKIGGANERERERESKPLRGFVKFLFSFVFALTLFFTVHSSVYATSYYVDTAITDTNPASATPDFTTYNPTTFETTGGSNSVYKTIADVNLKSFSAGDNIYFRRGQTWNEQLTVSSSGSSGSPITFDAYGSGNKPVIDGQNTRAYGIYASGKSYVTYNNIKVQGATTAGFTISTGTNNNADSLEAISNVHGVYLPGTGGTFSNILAQGNTFNGILVSGSGTVTVNSSQGNSNQTGIQVGNFTGTATINNFSADSNSQNGLYISGSGPGTVIINTCTSSNNGTSGITVGTGMTVTANNCVVYGNHEDGFSSAPTTGQSNTFNCNYCKAYNNGSTTSSTSGDGFTAHENAVMNIKYCIAYGNYKSGAAMTGTSSGKIQNCTFYNNYEATNHNSNDLGDYGIWINATGNWIINNNITANHEWEMYITAVAVAGGGTIQSNYNIFNDSRGGNAFHYNNTNYNFSGWKTASGKDTNSINQDPLFFNIGSNDFHLQPSSPAINAGTDLSFTSDYIGTSVPQGSAPDIGAYEFLLPAAPTSLAQYKSDGTTTISSEAFTGESTVTLKFSMSSTNSSDSFTPQVEVQPNGTSFTNSVTNSGSTVAYSGSPVTGTVTVTGLTTGTTYHWQARINNSAGAGSWVSMGGNPDFKIDTTAPSVPGTPSTTTPTSTTKPAWAWTASTDSGGSGLANPAYTLQWSTDSSFGSGVNTTTVNTNSFTHSTALTDGTWYFRVKAIDAVSNSSSYSSNGSVVIDTAGPTSGSLSSPTGYTKDNTKPTLVFKKASDSGSGLSSYSVSLDSGKNRSFSTSGIPATGNGTGNYVWKDDSTVKVTFVNENDSDSSNDEIQVYFKGLDTTELSEGKHTWTVTTYDNVNNSTSTSADFYIDRTSPAISELAIANVSTILSGVSYNLDISNRMPSFSGLAADSYQGSTITNSNGTKDTFDKVSSGPQTLTLTFKKQKSDQTYADYSTKDFSLSDIQDINGDKKSTRFYVTTPFPLVDGYYQVTIVLKDSAGNSYSQPVFYLALNASKTTSPIQNLYTNNLETKITNQETVPAVTQEEKQQVKENGYIVKVKVVDTKNQPVTGAKVTIHSKVQETTTDKNGIAIFNSVESGQHKILIAYSGYTGEQTVNLTGDVKEFDFNIQVKQTNAFLNPQVILVIGIMAFIILVTVVLLIKAKRKG